ncbi:MAG: 2-oxoacid:acceptor oxidoreductase family protein [Lachnospiraceae bacterium]|nr:2-oxoacid:acceptor oxidoreductase family protein [Lachnospiraceae bacterium]
MEQVKCEFALKDRLESGQSYYEIRLESIGGLGANLCGKMLGELGVKYLGVNSSSFSSYGSEKTGTPVKGYVRYTNKENEIRVHSPVEDPDLLVIFHQALLKDKSVLKGCKENTAVIISLEPGRDIYETIKGLNSNNCFGLEGGRIAMETHSRINVVMLGATLKLMGVEDVKLGERICEDALGKKYPEALKNNLEGIRRGYEEVRKLEVAETEASMEKEIIDGEEKKHKKIARNITSGMDNDQEWGYRTAPIGGINPRFGSTIILDVSPSRQGYIPLFIKERCINCGQCHSTCPDMVFQFVKGEYKGREMMVNQGLDYYHCKGCLRCVEICPVNALVQGVEAEHPNKEYFMKNVELIRKPKYYEEAGPDGYITSESYLTEKRMEGGEV